MTGQTAQQRRSGSMKAYKERGGQAPAELVERVRVQNHIKAAVRRALANGPATPPEVAQASGVSSREAFWTLMALRKYGTVIEDGESGGYVRYALSGKDPRA